MLNLLNQYYTANGKTQGYFFAVYVKKLKSILSQYRRIYSMNLTRKFDLNLAKKIYTAYFANYDRKNLISNKKYELNLVVFVYAVLIR